jgi:hypothetical protein
MESGFSYTVGAWVKILKSCEENFNKIIDFETLTQQNYKIILSLKHHFVRMTLFRNIILTKLAYGMAMLYCKLLFKTKVKSKKLKIYILQGG